MDNDLKNDHVSVAFQLHKGMSSSLLCWSTEIEDWAIEPVGSKNALFTFQAPEKKGEIHLVCFEKSSTYKWLIWQ